MPKNHVLLLIIGGIIVLLGYNQYTLNTKLQQEALLKQQENDQQNIKYCLDKIEPQLKQEENKYRIPRDRGCFLEAGGMSGVTDPTYKAKFDQYNDVYYKECLNGLYREIEEIRPGIKKDMLDECLKDFNK